MVNITVITVVFIFMSSSFYACLIPRDAVVKNPPTNAGDVGLVLGSGRSPAEGNISSLQYSCLENLHGQRSLADYSPWGHRELDMTEHTHTFHICLWKIKTLFSLWKTCYVPHNRLLKCVQNHYLFLAPSDRLELSPFSNPAERCFLAWAFVAQLAKNLPAMQETLVWFLGREGPLDKG